MIVNTASAYQSVDAFFNHVVSVLLFRKKLEMTEAIKVKEAEAETYISEIKVSFMTSLFFILKLYKQL